MTDPTDPSQTQAALQALGAFVLIGGIIGLAFTVFAVIIYWKILSKAGYNGALGLLMLVPIANLIILCILAFGEWPIYRELNQLRQMAAGRQPQFPSGPQYPQNPPY